MNSKDFVGIIMATLLAAMSAAAQTNFIKFQSGPEQTALLELYTSEGCSSCPPAEAWLSGLQESPGLWKDFAPVGFHVDYWNHLGWKDVWSDPQFSERQRDYAQFWHSENIYTPEFVLNGKEWHHWFSGKNGPRAGGAKVGKLTLISKNTNRWEASFVPEHPQATPYEIHAALLIGGTASDVKAGENNGRRLHHDFVAVNLLQMGLATTNGTAKGAFFFDTRQFRSAKTLSLVAWVTQAGQIEPLQTAGGWLTAPAGK